MKGIPERLEAHIFKGSKMTEIKQGAPADPPKPLEAKTSEKPVIEHGSRDNATKPGIPRTSQSFGEPKWAT